MAEPVIETQDLAKDYWLGTHVVHALRDVSVTIDAGELVAIMGPSGSGKSTYMSLLGCLDTPTSGRYLLEGRDVSELDDDALARVRNGEATQDDIDGATKVALLGQTVAQNLFGSADPVGQVIRVKKVPLTVIGVLARKGQSTQGQDQDDTVLVPLSTAKKKVLGISAANARAVNGILVKVREATAMKGAEEAIHTLLRQRHRLQAGQDDDFTLRNLSEILESQEASSRVLSLLLAAIASVSLLVGGIGIMNIMLVSVTERTREIGLRRAVGARRRDILTQFLIEAVTVSLAGGLIGIVVGIAGAWAIGYFAGWPAPIQARSVVPAFLFAAAVGVFFGFYPARKASRLNPIDALRYE